MAPRLISLIVPILNEAENAAGLADHLLAVTRANPEYRFEVVVVDDGSTDGSAPLLVAALDNRLPLRVVTLSRNFGSHYAISAGLDHVRGDAAIVLGADQQEPVDLVGRFIRAWNGGSDVVWGIRRTRAEGGGAGMVSRLFSVLFHRYSEIRNYPAEGPSGVLVDRSVVDAVRGLKERHRNILGLIAWVGFTQTRVEYDQLPRAAGVTKWSRWQLLKLAIDSFVEFSYTPIRLVAILGVAVSAVGFVYAAFLAVRAFGDSPAPEGWTTVIVVSLLLGGVQLIVLAIFGEYLWRATDEARGRPVYVVRSAESHGAVDDVRIDAGE